MREKPPQELERHRTIVGHLGSDHTYGMAGAFMLPGPRGDRLAVLSSGNDDGTGWEHVSVSKQRNPPNWDEMCFVKDLFWGEDECVMQIHPPKADYINNHPHCLHLWRPRDVGIPRPPFLLVGYKGGSSVHATVGADHGIPDATTDPCVGHALLGVDDATGAAPLDGVGDPATARDAAAADQQRDRDQQDSA